MALKGNRMASSGKRWPVQDRDGTPTYLTEERWQHIVEANNHPEMADYENQRYAARTRLSALSGGQSASQRSSSQVWHLPRYRNAGFQLRSIHQHARCTGRASPLGKACLGCKRHGVLLHPGLGFTSCFRGNICRHSPADTARSHIRPLHWPERRQETQSLLACPSG